MRKKVKNLLNSVLHPRNLHVRRSNKITSRGLGLEIVPFRSTMGGFLYHIKKLDFMPKTIFDVGVADGTWQIYDTFPDSKLILIEPLEEFNKSIKNVLKKFPDSIIVNAAASSCAGTSKINVYPHSEITSSSLYREDEKAVPNVEERTITTVTLDSISKENNLKEPYLIKIDVQGAELDVLMGAKKILEKTECVILEVVLFNFFNNNIQFYEIVNFMKKNCFVTYDIFDIVYRPIDGAISHVDIAFVKEKSKFRKHHIYATDSQRQILRKIRK